MKKTNVILGVIIAVFVICAATILLIAYNKNKENEDTPVQIDLAALSMKIEESTDFDSSKMKQVTLSDLVNDFGVDESWVSGVIGEIPYVNVSSSMYVVVEATDGNVDNLINAFENYGNTYEGLWKDYLPEEYELVKNRKIGSVGNYVYFIVSDYASNIIDLMK